MHDGSIVWMEVRKKYRAFHCSHGRELGGVQGDAPKHERRRDSERAALVEKLELHAKGGGAVVR